MAIDATKKMVLIDGQIVTSELAYCIYDEKKKLYAVRRNGRIYHYSPQRVRILENVGKLDAEQLKMLEQATNFKILAAWRFEAGKHEYYHLFLQDHTNLDLDGEQIASHKVFSYLQKIANTISNEQNFLSQLYAKVSYKDSKESALKYYLQQEDPDYFTMNGPLIFPFGCNKSQYDAVENAIRNSISVIEGPPGTGKTQTILNIIANLIIREKSCQVVSNNNFAIENIEDKLKEYDLDFFTAKLGSNSNRLNFIENQKNIPDLSQYATLDKTQLLSHIEKLQQDIQSVFQAERQLAQCKQQLSEVQAEYKHFEKYLQTEKIKTYPFKRKNNLYKAWLEIQNQNRIGLWLKLKCIFLHGVGNLKFYKNTTEEILATIQNTIYLNKISELTRKCSDLSYKVETGKACTTEFQKKSMLYFQRYLAERYEDHPRKRYEADKVCGSFYEFIYDYPVILSTTFSARSSFGPNIKFDYVIMDEASQIDVVTGALALSSGKNAVIVGDEKQLPNVVTDRDNVLTGKISKSYRIDAIYEYSSKNSFLSSVKQAIPSVPVCLLREHYRCQPKIIEFCNRQFYDSQLIVMTEDVQESNAIQIIRTNEGNHARGHVNQRQIDIIKDILSNLESNDVGIIAPYNDQVDEIRKAVPGEVEVSTIHKFQGREKDVIIISTVDNEISDFVNDPHILNVAISRAKRRLIMIVTGNQIDNTIIDNFVEYANYYNFKTETSPIYSIFDYLYGQYTNERIEFLAHSKRVSEYDSENLMYATICEVLKQWTNLGVLLHQPLNMLIRDKTLMTNDERRFASNPLTHLDFLIYNKITRKPILAIEVDGATYHQKNTKQAERDSKKDVILAKYQIPLIRFRTTGSQEKEKLHDIIKGIMGRK